MTTEAITRIIVRTYEGANESDSFAIVEASDPDVDLIVHPFTDDAFTISLSPDQAWRLARELARMSSAVEQREAD